MIYSLLGDGLVELLGRASRQVIIAAPYIKVAALVRLLSAISYESVSLICVTRWRPEDIADGVCDIGIYEKVTERANGKLLVQPHLHAKYFRADDACMIGSANVTDRALGWFMPTNVELLVRLSADFEGLPEWEAQLLRSSVPATTEMRDHIKAEAERIKATRQPHPSPEVEPGESSRSGEWVPTCPVPDRLWEVYQGGGASTMVSSAFQAAEDDLSALMPPAGLSKGLFEAFIAGILRQTRLLVEVDRLATTGLADQDAKIILARDFLPNGSSADAAWEVLKRWLAYFFPQEYRIETSHEVLIKGSTIRSPRS